MEESNMTARSRIVAALVLLLGAESVVSQDESQTITVPLSRRGEPVSLKIAIFSARIEVIGEDRQDVAFAVTPDGKERKIVTPSGTRTLAGGSYEVRVDEKDNRISIGTDPNAGRVAIVARIPRRADLDLSTQHDGEIVVRNVVGHLQLENGNGPISATNIDGSVIAEGMNEALTVSFSRLSRSDAMALSSLNGDITLSLPAKAGVELRLDTARGQVDSEFEMEVKPATPAIERSERRDGVSVRVKDVVVATINGGGNVIRIKTLSGNIRIGKSGN
jgi:hypothetical protein